MKKHGALALLMIFVFASFGMTACFDRRQHYHEGFEEFEHYINDSLGEYLVLYACTEMDGVNVIEVWFQPSYNFYSVDRTREGLPLRNLVDSFRCLTNDFVRSHPGYFAADARYQFKFCYEGGDHVESPVALICNYIPGTDEVYDHFVAERFLWDDHYETLSELEDLVCVYLTYNGDESEPSREEYLKWFRMQIELFPNLKYIKIPDEHRMITRTEADSITAQLLEEYDHLSELPGDLALWD